MAAHEYENDTPLYARRGTIEIEDGASRLSRHFREQDAEPIPALLLVKIEGRVGEGEPSGKVFEFSVDDVFTNADHTVTPSFQIARNVPPDSHFGMSADCLERLDCLAESTITKGFGMLASSNYYGQGYVNVPSRWLRELICAYRVQNPAAAAWLYHLRPIDHDGKVKFIVTFVEKDHWESENWRVSRPLPDGVLVRLPRGAQEITTGVYVFADRSEEYMVAELYDAGFRPVDPSTEARIPVIDLGGAI